MALTSLLVCADAKTVQVLTRILQELGTEVEHWGDPSEAAARLSVQQFDALLVDCVDEKAAMKLLAHARQTEHNPNTVAILLVDGKNNVRDIFAKGANFVLYKPISAERANTSLRAARGLMRREKRISRRASIHTQASIAYASNEDALATLVNLSEHGISIQAQRKLPPRCKVYFQFSLPGQSSVVRLSGEMAWQDATGRVGLRFADVPQSSRRMLNEWLQAHVAGQSEASILPELIVETDPETGSEAEIQVSALGNLTDSASERRIQSRHSCRLGAEIYRQGSKVPNRCNLSDISTGGCYVETSTPFPAGTDVAIVLRTEDMKIDVQGVVLASHPGFGMGVRFSLQTAGQRQQVEKLVACQEAQEENSEPETPVEPV